MKTLAIILAVIILLALLVFGASAIYSKWLRLVTVNITNKKVTKPYKILLLSDLHNNCFGKDNEKLISLIKNADPDYITIAGDLIIDDVEDLSVAKNLIDKLSLMKKRIIYVPGNHELKYSKRFPKQYEDYLDFLFEKRVTYLDDDWYESQEILFCGYTNKLNQFKKFSKPYKLTCEEIEKEIKLPESAEFFRQLTLPEKAGVIEGDKVRFFVTHNPVYFPEYVRWGAEHVVAGHLHGGIVRLPFLGGILSPQTFLFPKYDFGTYYIGKATMTVSAGLGVHTIPIRLFNRPDVTLINLEPSGNA